MRVRRVMSVLQGLFVGEFAVDIINRTVFKGVFAGGEGEFP